MEVKRMEYFNKALGIKALAGSPGKKAGVGMLSFLHAKLAGRFHATMPGYRVTPLAKLDRLAKSLGIAGVYVKDESYRFGLNAFKVLGGSFAIASLLAEKLGMDISRVSFDMLRSGDVRSRLGDAVFVTATDGNHGRGVAWTAEKLGCRSVVYLPKGAVAARVHAIREAGAEVIVTDLNYDDAVRLAARMAEEKGWWLVQDTAWEGYEKVPAWIMQGYTTMAVEALEQLRLYGEQRPTHVFLQAGVGSMAGAVLGYLVNRYGPDYPASIIIEPENAACLYQSAGAKDKKLCRTEGSLETIMAGLACGEPCSIAWEILRDYSDYYCACPDYVAAKGMRILANPLGNDPKVVSGESGAVGAGLLAILMQNRDLFAMREAFGLDEKSVVLLFSTEGNTDPENYRDVVWDAKYPSV